jgi:signal transduction histidine kinase
VTVAVQGVSEVPYRGPDRRRRNDGLLVNVDVARVASVTLVVTVIGWIPALFLVPRGPSVSALGVYAAIAGGLLLGVAGGTQLIIWKVTGRAYFGWVGVACVVLGVLVVIADGLSRYGTGPVQVVRPIDDLFVTLVAGYLIWRGLADHEVNAELHPIATLAFALGAGLLSAGLLDAAHAAGSVPEWTSARPSEIGFDLASALVWIAIAAVALRAVRRGAPGTSIAGVCFAVLLALGSILQAISPMPWATTLAGPVCLFAASAVVLGVSVDRVLGMLAGEDRSRRRLQLALTATAYQAARDRRSLDAWLHDLRNAVAGLQAADAVLRQGAHAGTRAEPELANAVTAELARLHAMIDPARQLRTDEVDLAATLTPLVAAERARGASIALRLEATTVVADAGALSRVVQNLLTNARLYAGGSQVTLAAVRRGRVVELSVQDRGPGIPPSERELVFERGERGAAGEGIGGSGLGLYVVRTLMAAMGGSVRMADGAPGCTMVLTLPAPPLAAVVPGDTLSAADAHSGQSAAAHLGSSPFQATA